MRPSAPNQRTVGYPSPEAAAFGAEGLGQPEAQMQLKGTNTSQQRLQALIVC